MKISRRAFLVGAGAALVGVGLPAWATLELIHEKQLTPFGATLFPDPGGTGDRSANAAVHLLSRISFGPTVAEVSRIQQMGIEAYLDEQLHPERLDDGEVEQRLQALSTLRMDAADLLGQKPQDVIQELQQATALRALYSRRQLQEVLADFWSNHFNIYIGKAQCRFLKTVDDRQVIRPHVLGRFRDLLGASAKSPAMLQYLDNVSNRKQAPNENYARELMELHTLSVTGGYTEADVEAVARCFTGWTYDKQGQFIFRAGQHDTRAKTVLGTTIPAGSGIDDGERVLDLLARHPQTAHFIAFKLCRHFVSDQPPDSLVQNIASVFQATDGDIRQVVSAIFHAPEFAQSVGQKFRRPAEHVIAAARAIGVETDAKALVRTMYQLGQPYFGAQFPTGYSDVAATWLNTGGLLARWNFALALADGRISDIHIDLSRLVGSFSTASGVAQELVRAILPSYSATDLPDHLASFLGGAKASSGQLQQRLPIAAGLLLAAPVFQWK